MDYIQEVSVSGMCGNGDVSMVFGPRVNLIYGGNGAGKTTIIRILNSALMGDSSLLRGGHFERAELKLSGGENGPLFNCSISKGDVPLKNERADGSDSASVWRIEPEPGRRRGPRGMFLPRSRRYFSGDVFARRLPCVGDPMEKTVSHALHALWKEYHQGVAKKYRESISNGSVDILKALFSKRARQSEPLLAGSPESAYMRVSSFLDRVSLGDPMISLSTFKNELKNDDGSSRIANSIISTENTIDRLKGELETLEAMANNMLGRRYHIAIDMDGMRLTSKRGNPVERKGLSAGEMNALIMLFAALVARGRVLLVDDVEASLHPDVYKDLVDNMSALNPEGQMILSTHSMRIMDCAKKWNEAANSSRTFFMEGGG